MCFSRAATQNTPNAPPPKKTTVEKCPARDPRFLFSSRPLPTARPLPFAPLCLPAIHAARAQHGGAAHPTFRAFGALLVPHSAGEGRRSGTAASSALTKLSPLALFPTLLPLPRPSASLTLQARHASTSAARIVFPSASAQPASPVRAAAARETAVTPPSAPLFLPICFCLAFRPPHWRGADAAIVISAPRRPPPRPPAAALPSANGAASLFRRNAPLLCPCVSVCVCVCVCVCVRRRLVQAQRATCPDSMALPGVAFPLERRFARVLALRPWPRPSPSTSFRFGRSVHLPRPPALRPATLPRAAIVCVSRADVSLAIAAHRTCNVPAPASRLRLASPPVRPDRRAVIDRPGPPNTPFALLLSRRRG